MWKWTREKNSQKTLPSNPVVYPVGTALRTEKNTYMILKDGQKYRFYSQRVIDSWKLPFVVETSEAALSKYPTAYSKLGFREGTLVNNMADGKIYLVSNSRLRHITSPDALSRLGLGREDAVWVSNDEIEMMKKGEALS